MIFRVYLIVDDRLITYRCRRAETCRDALREIADQSGIQENIFELSADHQEVGLAVAVEVAGDRCPGADRREIESVRYGERLLGEGAVAIADEDVEKLGTDHQEVALAVAIEVANERRPGADRSEVESVRYGERLLGEGAVAVAHEDVEKLGADHQVVGVAIAIEVADDRRPGADRGEIESVRYGQRLLGGDPE